MTSALVAVETDSEALEADPVAYMATVLHRAKSWLDEAQNIDEVRNAKAIAIGYESVIREKEMAFDAQLAATEIVRRCERRVGELVRKGQAEGTISSAGGDRRSSNVTAGTVGPSKAAIDYIGTGGKTQHEHRALADAPAEDFDAAIEEAKAEGNLSRANVVRKVKGEPKPESRSEWHHKKRHIDSSRIVRETVLSLEGACVGLELVDFGALDVLERLEWVESLRSSLSVLNRFIKELSK